MNRFFTWLVSCKRAGLLLLSLLAIFRPPSLQAAYRVTHLHLSSLPEGVRLTIKTDRPAQYSSFTIGHPEPRLVVDLTNAVHALDAYRYDHPAVHLVNHIRTSQYRPYPHPTVRIVLDLTKLVPYEITAVDSGLVVFLQDRTPDLSSGMESPGGNTVLAPPEGKSVAIKPTEASGSILDISPATDEPAAPQISQTAVKQQPIFHSASTVSSDSMDTGTSAVAAESGGPQQSLLARLSALGIREPVWYHSDSRRDPFVPLPASQKVEFGQAPLPDVEKLSIVGILDGVDGYRALAQDESDNGYVLRKGDRVLYGYVARIEAERVVFHLNRRGLDRTIILKLPQ